VGDSGGGGGGAFEEGDVMEVGGETRCLKYTYRVTPAALRQA